MQTDTQIGPTGQKPLPVADDLDSGRWAERNSDLADLDAADLGLRLLIA